jgi:hypothetical protein
MLVSFGTTPDPSSKKKRSSKLHRKLATQLMSERLAQMREELTQMSLLDQCLASMRHEQKNLSS